MCEEFASEVGDLHTALLNAEKNRNFDPAVLADWTRRATHLDGVTNVASDVEEAVEALKVARNAAVTAQAVGEKLVPALIAGDAARRAAITTLRDARIQNVDLGECAALTPGLLLSVQTELKELGEIIVRQTALLESLSKLLAALRTYEKQTWRNGGKDLVFDTVVTSPATIKTPTTTFKAITYSYDKVINAISSKVDVETARTFDVRRLRRLVSEYGVAAVYNDLKYPKYLVKDGKVGQEFDKSNVNLAATLNFLCGSCIGSGVYPGFQFGISKAKDYPGLLAGGVLRFGGTNRISIASGVMVTWYKDLNTLKVDGAVDSEEKLKNDLKLRHSPGTWYIAVQYTFP